MKVLLLLVPLLLFPSCATRSISDSGTSHDSAYVGEIHDLNLFGTLSFVPGAPAPAAPKGSRILLVQSGSYYPDEPLLAAFEAHHEVLPLTGVPLNTQHSMAYGGYYRDAGVHAPGTAPTGQLLQAAARSGGAEAIVVVWGVLEGSTEAEAGKAAVWVPIVGYFIPDETQTLRIRLKAAVIDPQSGRWRLVLPDSLEDRAISSTFTRDEKDQAQVRALKARAYPALAQAVLRPGS